MLMLRKPQLQFCEQLFEPLLAQLGNFGSFFDGIRAQFTYRVAKFDDVRHRELLVVRLPSYSLDHLFHYFALCALRGSIVPDCHLPVIGITLPAMHPREVTAVRSRTGETF